VQYIIDHVQNRSEKWMMEMISGKIYGTSESILEPEDETPHTLKFSKWPNVLQIALTRLDVMLDDFLSDSRMRISFGKEIISIYLALTVAQNQAVVHQGAPFLGLVISDDL
jgi:hypothetical protein